MPIPSPHPLLLPLLVVALSHANPVLLKRQADTAPASPLSILDLSTPVPTAQQALDATTALLKAEVKAALGSTQVSNSTDEQHMPVPRDFPLEADVPTTPGTVFEQWPRLPEVDVCDDKNAPGRSQIYCYGKLLEAVNQHRLFPDSKTFVDRPIKANRTGGQIYNDFLKKFPQEAAQIDKEELAAFVEENFDKEGHELDECSLLDWSDAPSSFAGIADSAMHKFALDLNNIWSHLCRRVKPIVKDEPERYSLMYVPHNFVAPGGRFREFYYWDAYWIVKGLLASGMLETTRGMIYNFASIVEKYGFIPNGGRVYYLRRSQPPLLTAMVYEYYEVTRNTTFLKDVLPILEKELAWWKTERSVDVPVKGQNISMFQYRTAATVPRPESYREDKANAANFPSEGRKQQFYKDVGSAAESGWDFSTRWFSDRKTLLSIHTTEVVPVDLNAYICYNLNILSFLHSELGNVNKERSWRAEYLMFRDAFQHVFYLPEAKGWYDYDLRNQTHNTAFYPSIAVPLFTGCYEDLSLTQSNDLYDRMADLGVFDFVGGIPTSLANGTQEQWDFPNGWSPLNHMIIEGLRKSDNPRMQKKAFALAEKWVRSNYKVWLTDKAMWEKYNVATNEPRTGGGGEYEVQAGFGWTNGAILDILLTYGDRLMAGDAEQKMAEASAVQSEGPAADRFSSHPSSSSHSLSLIALCTVLAKLLL